MSESLPTTVSSAITRAAAIVEVVAVDVERGWLLMRDAGSRLRELVAGAEQIKHWLAILPKYAELQLVLAPRVDRFLALGVPDERLRRLAHHFERMLGDEDILFVGRPDGVTLDELGRLRHSAPMVASMCSDLAAVGIPETIQHDDFHDGQVFVREGRYRFLDWGDSCVSHPFHTMVVTLRVLAWQQGLPPGGPELLRLRDAYLEPFEELASPVELRAAFSLAHKMGTIGRALAWHRYFVGDPRAERDDTVAYGLKMFLADGPIASWEPWVRAPSFRAPRAQTHTGVTSPRREKPPSLVVYAQGPLWADREGWAAQARRTSLDATLPGVDPSQTEA